MWKKRLNMIANVKPTPNPKPEKVSKRMASSLSCHKPLGSCDIIGVVESGPSHCVESGFPQSPVFPSNEVLGNERNWFPCGILPVKLLYERFNQEREVREVSCCGIFPERLFHERSIDSSRVRLPSYDGICPMKLLYDMLSPCSETRLPIDSGM